MKASLQIKCSINPIHTREVVAAAVIKITIKFAVKPRVILAKPTSYSIKPSYRTFMFGTGLDTYLKTKSHTSYMRNVQSGILSGAFLLTHRTA